MFPHKNVICVYSGRIFAFTLYQKFLPPSLAPSPPPRHGVSHKNWHKKVASLPETWTRQKRAQKGRLAVWLE